MFRVVMFVNDAVEFIYSTAWSLTEGEATCVAEALSQYSKRLVEVQFKQKDEDESAWRRW